MFVAAIGLSCLFVTAGCRDGDLAIPDAASDALPPWDVDDPEPVPRPGMVWIPAGVLLAGTPPERLPRVADEEMAGEQVMMRGFYIDIHPYPNELGAIPATNMTQAEAQALCEAQDKRLCTELEWERACKGPANMMYEHGDVYKPAICATGTNRTLVPNGFNGACRSGFGVHDMHGTIWTWTQSQWRRDSTSTGAKQGLWVVRGGNGVAGELIARCANGRGLRPDRGREDVGVRCCAGEVNTFEVVLSVTRGTPLSFQQPESRIAPLLEQGLRVGAELPGGRGADPQAVELVPPEFSAALRGRRVEDQFKVERMWTWHPLGNEELVVGGGCARAPDRGHCGIAIARVRSDVLITPSGASGSQGQAPSGSPPLSILAFVSSDEWQPTLGETETRRELFLYGGDVNGAFRKRVSYEWGRIGIGKKERKKHRKGKKPIYH